MECTELAVDGGPSEPKLIVGYADTLEFRSSLTLFHIASDVEGNVFEHALEGSFNGQRDPGTYELVAIPKYQRFNLRHAPRPNTAPAACPADSTPAP